MSIGDRVDVALRPIATVLCFLGAAIASAAEVEVFDLPRLMQLLAATPAAEVSSLMPRHQREMPGNAASAFVATSSRCPE